MKKSKLTTHTLPTKPKPAHKTIFDELEDHSEETKNIVNKFICYYSDIILAMPGNVYWMDANAKAVGCNQNVLDMLGLEHQDEFYGLSFDDMAKLGKWSDNDKQSFQKDTENVLQTGVAKRNVVEPPIPGPDGSTTYFLSSRVPLRDTNNNITGIVGISTDITAQKQAQDQAELANMAKTNFLMNMSHDLRTPFSGILGVSRLLLSQETDPSKQSLLQDVVSSSEQLLHLLNDILDISQNESHTIKPNKEELDLREMLNNISELFKAETSKKQLTIAMDYPPDIPYKFITDKTILYRIILNLINNAIKFTTEGGITIRVSKTPYNNITIDIIDTGIGISPDNIDNIFNLFTKVSPSYQGNYQGAGIGLNLVKQLVETINGSITVTSEINKGSTFTITAPLQQLIPSCHQYNSNNNIGPIIQQLNNEHPKILIVEDDSISQRFAKLSLEQHACEITTANNAAEALQHDASQFDIILIDIGLPDMPGDLVAKKISEQEKTKQKPMLIALTAHIIPDKVSSYFESGFSHVLQKPLTY